MSRLPNIPQNLTGTALRMKSLPCLNISSMDVYGKHVAVEPMNGDENSRKVDDASTCITKCIYKYTDRYKNLFTRILTDDSFSFDSHFESGNLHTVFRLYTPQEANLSGVNLKVHTYDLYLHNDIYTNGNTQWFYFKVSNVKAGQQVTFNIKNFRKTDSLFKRGMKPLVFSKKLDSWSRSCYAVDYYLTEDSTSEIFESVMLDMSNIQGKPKKKSKRNSAISKASSSVYYTLTFSHNIQCDDDTVYFSYCYPYTYTDLQKYLHKIQTHKTRSVCLRRKLLCRTIGGNRCEELTITSKAATLDELTSRSVILLSARVHPGETNSSFIMHGIIDFLTSEDDDAKLLRDKYIFKIIPMLNPDGVINGNYRTSLAGCDLNRRWRNPDKDKHPTVFHTKDLIKRIKKYYVIGLLVDLHGHSIKKGIFTYGCLADKKQARGYYPLLQPGQPSQPFASSSAPNSARNNPIPLSQRSDNSNVTGKDSCSVGVAMASSSAKSVVILTTESTSISSQLDQESIATSSRVEGLSPLARDNIELPSTTDFEGITSEDYAIGAFSDVAVSPYSGHPGISTLLTIDGFGKNVSSTSQKGRDISPLRLHESDRPVTGSVNISDVLRWKVKLFPRLIGNISNIFAYENCTFSMQKSKVESLRMVAFLELGIDNAYTLEASLAGFANDHFSALDLCSFGKDLCRTLLVLYPAISITNTPIAPQAEKDLSSTGFADEIREWRQYYSPKDYSTGMTALADRILYEFQNVNVDLYKDDSDDDSVAAPETPKKRKSTTKASNDVQPPIGEESVKIEVPVISKAGEALGVNRPSPLKLPISTSSSSLANSIVTQKSQSNHSARSTDTKGQDGGIASISSNSDADQSRSVPKSIAIPASVTSFTPLKSVMYKLDEDLYSSQQRSILSSTPQLTRYMTQPSPQLNPSIILDPAEGKYMPTVRPSRPLRRITNDNLNAQRLFQFEVDSLTTTGDKSKSPYPPKPNNRRSSVDATVESLHNHRVTYQPKSSSTNNSGIKVPLTSSTPDSTSTKESQSRSKLASRLYELCMEASAANISTEAIVDLTKVRADAIKSKFLSQKSQTNQS